MAHSHSVKEYPGQLALIAGVAAAVGAGVALLVSPKSGRENREAVKQRAASVKNKAKQTPSKASEVAKTATKQMTGKVANKKDAMKPVSENQGKIKSESDRASEASKDGTKRNGRNSKDMTDEIRRNGEP
jgi:gas vesicle protein